MIYNSAKEWRESPHKKVALFGMSGLGKTYLSNMLSKGGDWFHYSVDYRIATHHMAKYITDSADTTFENLAPLSTYLGKPGSPALGGIPFEEYILRQRQHRLAEIAASQDVQLFAQKARDIYGHAHFIADTSGSVCEVVDAENPEDPTLKTLSSAALPVWIRGGDAHTSVLINRFSAAPKPMYYPEDFLRTQWQTYLAQRDISQSAINPDDFILQGYRALLEHRLPRYASIAKNWGVTVEADEVRDIRDEADFNALIALAIERRI